MNDNTIITLAAVAALVALLGSTGSDKDDTNQPEPLKEERKEHSLARNFEASPDVVKGMNNIPVKKEKGQLSRAIEPNHRVSNLNGLRLE
ncbi:MAG: hypothetical protein DRG11_07585 [Epsilonproteobacteria bacterium]|nr:MAG: hypothetical protein DRG11_07585 [Campylobacterota bacterium]